MDAYLQRLKEFAATMVDGSVEFVPGRTQIIGRISYDSIPTFQVAYQLFGPTNIAIMAKPDFDGMWSVALVSMR